MFEIGRLCIKTQGRDASKYCLIINKIDEKYVLIDGNTRRRKVNVSHLEPFDRVLNVKKDASTKEVLEEFKKENIKVEKHESPKSNKVKKVQFKKLRKGMDKNKEVLKKEDSSK